MFALLGWSAVVAGDEGEDDTRGCEVLLRLSCLTGDPVEQSILSGDVSSSRGGIHAQRLEGLSSETPEGKESTLGMTEL